MNLSNRENRRHLPPQVKIRSNKHHENQWFNVAEELEVAVVSGNSQRLFKPKCDTNGWRTSVCEVVCQRNIQLIKVRQQRLGSRAEHFKNQFSRAHTDVVSPTPAAAND